MKKLKKIFEPYKQSPRPKYQYAPFDWSSVLDKLTGSDWWVIAEWKQHTSGYKVAKQLRTEFPGFEFQAQTNATKDGSKLFARKVG